MAQGGVLRALLLALGTVLLAEVAAAAPRLPAGKPPAFARA